MRRLAPLLLAAAATLLASACAGKVVTRSDTGADAGPAADAEGPAWRPHAGTGGAAVWSRRFGDSSSQQRALSVAAAAGGATVVGGKFRGTIDLGGGPVKSTGDIDAFVAKFGPAGEYWWTTTLGDTGTKPGAEQEVQSVAVGPAGDVWIAGLFGGETKIGAEVRASQGHVDAFAARLDASGKVLWSRVFASPNVEVAASVAVPPGIVPGGPPGAVVAGTFFTQIDAGGGPLVSAGNSDVFVVRLDEAGKHVWSTRIGGAGADAGPSVAFDATGDVFVAGTAGGPFDLGGTNVAGPGAFVARLGPTGAPVWARGIEGAHVPWGRAIAAGAAGGVLLGGWFSGSLDAGGGAMASAGATDAFVASIGASGATAWNRRLGGAGYDAAWSVAPLAGGGYLVGGYAAGTVDFGGGPIGGLTTTGGFVARFDAGGAHVWSRRLGGQSDTDEAVTAAGDGADGTLAAGYFTNKADLGGPAPIDSAGGEDGFVAKFGP